MGGARNYCIVVIAARASTVTIRCALFGTLMSMMEDVCERLDSVLLEVMSTLKELCQLREQYNAAVKEVSVIFCMLCWLRMQLT